MSLHRVLADVQAVRHYFIRAALRDKFQNFYFSRRQELIGGVLPQFCRYFWLYVTQTSVDRADRV